MIDSEKKSILIFSFCIILSIAVFFLDLFTPIEIADGDCYVPLVLFTILTDKKGYTLFMAGFTTILTIIGFFYTKDPILVDELGNRILAFIGISFITYVILKQKRVKALVQKQKGELELLNEELEGRVLDRTKILEEILVELEKSKKDLNAAIKKEKELNEMKTHFISTASHEFRTPIATIMSSFFLLLKYFENNNKEGQLKHINRITSSINYLTELLNDMFTLNLIEEGQMSPVPEKFNIQNFVSEIILEMQTISNANQRIIYNHSGHCELNQDRKIMKRILINLISNALKFSDQDKLVNISTEIKDSILTLSIKDQGIGISEKDQEHLFERFFRGKNADNISGVGLGLSIVSEYLDMLKGKIELSSSPESGTTFKLKISDTLTLS